MNKDKIIQPLDGIKVLDFSTLLPGPLASLILAEAGAEVIKVERPGFGEEMRYYPPLWDGQSAAYALLNRGKEVVEIDLKSEGAMAVLEPLVREADVVVEQFRPGVMKRLGLDYEALCKINPALIYCSITGYGQNGPGAGEVGHDLNYMARSGVLSLSTGTAEKPTIPPVLAADIAGGTYPAVINILLALRRRDICGEGVWLDIAMAENLFPFAFWALAEGQAGGQWPQSGKGLLNGGSPRYQLYPARCGRLVAVAALEDKFWLKFCAIMGVVPGYEDAGDKIMQIAALIAQKPASEWERILVPENCCCTIVKTLAEAMGDAQFVSRGVFAHKLQNHKGSIMNALPVPIMEVFRKSVREIEAVPGPLSTAAHDER